MKLKSFDDYEMRLGDIMRGERATLGKSLLDVQRELRIKAPYIAAIEDANPSAFDTPGLYRAMCDPMRVFLKWTLIRLSRHFALKAGLFQPMVCLQQRLCGGLRQKIALT